MWVNIYIQNFSLLMKAQMDAKILYQPSITPPATPWRQFAHGLVSDFCSALKFSTGHFLFQNFSKLLKRIIPLLMECPSKVPFRFEALKINYTEENEDDDGSRWYKVPLANGNYRNILKFSNDKDSEIFRFEWRTELKFSKNHDFFNKK